MDLINSSREMSKKHYLLWFRQPSPFSPNKYHPLPGFLFLEVVYKMSIAEYIDKAARGDQFYDLPTQDILAIIKKSVIDSPELLGIIASKMSEKKGDDAILLLNVIKPLEI